MASQNSTLPLDVISEVIGHLDLNTDILTLRALSRTCYALLEPSQRKLFSRLVIQVFSQWNRQSAYFRLIHIFGVSPHLAIYVQDLTATFETAYPDTYIVPILKKLGSIQTLQIKYTHWNKYPEGSLQWQEIISVILRHPSLRRLDLGGYGILLSTVWDFPALTHIDLGKWRIEDTESDDPRPSLKRRLAILWSQDDPCSTLRSLLRISPLLIHLKASQTSNPSRNPQFRGLSKAIIDSPLTLSTLETLTFLSPWDHSIPLAGILAELEELSLSNESVLKKIRIDLDCSDMSTRSKLLKCLEDIDNKVHWAGFPRLWSLEVNIDVPYIDVEDVPEESKRAAIIEDLENGIRDKFRRIKDREGMEVLITVYFEGKRPGGEVFNPTISWEVFTEQLTPTTLTLP